MSRLIIFTNALIKLISNADFLGNNKAFVENREGIDNLRSQAFLAFNIKPESHSQVYPSRDSMHE